MRCQVEILFPLAEVNDPATRAWFVDGGCNQSYGPGPTLGSLAPNALPHQIGTDTLGPNPAKTPTIHESLSAVTTQSEAIVVSKTLVYFEVIYVNGTTSHAPQIGIASSAFQVTPSPWSLDVSSTGPTCAEGIFWGLSAGGTSSQGRGYPTSGTTGFGGAAPTPGDIIGVAVNLVNHMAWIRNATQFPNNWYGSVSASTAEVEAAVKGFSFGPAGMSPITGNVYILGGSGWENFGSEFPLGSLTLNSAGPFVGTLPTDYVAWGTTTWNTGDSSPHLIFSNGNKTLITDQALPGSNQPSAFCRSSLALPQF